MIKSFDVIICDAAYTYPKRSDLPPTLNILT